MIYEILEKPVFVRDAPSSGGNVTDVLVPGKKINVISTKDGWFKLNNGRYVIKVPNNFKLIVTSIMKNNSIEENGLNSNVFKGIQRFDKDSVSGGSNQSGNQSTPSNGNDSSNSSANDASKSDANQSQQDTTSSPQKAAEMSLEEINEKYKGLEWVSAPGMHAYQIDEDGEILLDENGQPKMMLVPSTLLGRGNGSVIESVDVNGIVKVVDKERDVWYLQGEAGQVQKEEGSNDYESLPISEDMIQRREADSLLGTLVNLFSSNDEKSIFETLFGKIYDIYKIDVTNMHAIFGYPYQFLPVADPRILDPDKFSQNQFDESTVKTMKELKGLGREFSRKIASRAPVITIMPGIPIFLPGYSTGIKEYIIETLAGRFSDDNGVSSTALDEILSSSGRYYSFKPTPDEYYQAVNYACRAIAIFLGIKDVEIGSVKGQVSGPNETTKIGDFQWDFAAMHNYVGYYKGAVNFYANVEPQVHETFTNATRASQLAGSINQISDQAMEIQYILGGLVSGSGFEMTNFSEDLADEDASFRSGSGLVWSVIKNLKTFLSGGKMIFPEIWSDSNFSRGYNVSIKLTSPDCDPISIYLNILVPLIHILGLVLPRSAGDNSYISPFLVRAWFKSMYNIELGIITSCDIVKGDSGAWTQGGLPTQVTVQFTIKDLYSVMSQSLNNSVNNTLLNNPAQMNYIANLCGVNIAVMDIARTMSLYWMIATNQVTDRIFNLVPKATGFAYNRAEAIASIPRIIVGKIFGG